jgi:UDP-2-acetamido-3-amino-2,3-dideoxy-glucuronate N-acetyltransferase
MLNLKCSKMPRKIHEKAEVQSINIGDDTTIWQFCVVLKDAVIGRNCNINCHVFIENDVIIGDDVTIKPGVQLWDGIRIGNKVFVGPNVTFTNDLLPRSKQYPETFLGTIIKEGVSIGANATILAGVEIGEYALIGAGSLVSKNIPAFTLWYGNPAIQRGYVTKGGITVSINLKDKKGKSYILIGNEPKLI